MASLSRKEHSRCMPNAHGLPEMEELGISAPFFSEEELLHGHHCVKTEKGPMTRDCRA
jgi:hypothetical protein